ncbi:MAG: 50S ribosomal protein L25 [Deltaproteobacteria bacterium]|nr:50S ribosomal protein L25 [Deltaproteobacteria bacterium]
MNKPELAAQVRYDSGKGVARKLRQNNRVPGIFYGPGTESVMISLDYPELERIMDQVSGENILLDLKLQSEQGAETKTVMLKDLQTDPVKDKFVHVDFYEIAMDRKITVRIPINLLNIPKGVTEGGVLQHIRRELTITCLPDKLISSLDIDVSNLEIGDSLHVSALELPEEITSVDEGHLTIAIIAAPTISKAEEEEEEESAELQEESAEEA